MTQRPPGVAAPGLLQCCTPKGVRNTATQPAPVQHSTATAAQREELKALLQRRLENAGSATPDATPVQRPGEPVQHSVQHDLSSGVWVAPAECRRCGAACMPFLVWGAENAPSVCCSKCGAWWPARFEAHHG